MEFDQKHLALPSTKVGSDCKLVKQMPITLILFRRGGIFGDVSRR